MSLFPDDAADSQGRAQATSLALARRYRPRKFAELVGQDHVVRALTRALSIGRLHHAYLFTGTRGVGKTTIARIFAKAINCLGPDGQGGITAEPCGVCGSCREIDAGRFIDYIEMDAASNRGVAEMTMVLEQAVYKPTRGRFKVYMIDEVHMLSTHAFNAMLKTLEEPPEYVKFVLATTDPQKVPVTVLSRCLQFNLRQLRAAEIEGHLGSILRQEGIEADPQALALLARSAVGSVRDALSLTDQAIAYCGTRLAPQEVRRMLGVADGNEVVQLVQALIAGDGPALLRLAEQLIEASISPARVLDELSRMFHHLAALQVDPSIGMVSDLASSPVLLELSAAVAPEDLQLWYGIALRGRQELAFAPDELAGLSMTLLRMLSFGRGGYAPVGSNSNGNRAATPMNYGDSASNVVASKALQDDSSAADGIRSAVQSFEAKSAEPASPATARLAAEGSTVVVNVAGTMVPAASFKSEDWIELCRRLDAVGMARELAIQSECVNAVSRDGQGLHLKLRVPRAATLVAESKDKLASAVSAALGCKVTLEVELGAVTQSLALEESRRRTEHQAVGEQTARADDVSMLLASKFGASILAGSVKPLS